MGFGFCLPLILAVCPGAGEGERVREVMMRLMISEWGWGGQVDVMMAILRGRGGVEMGGGGGRGGG